MTEWPGGLAYADLADRDGYRRSQATVGFPAGNVEIT